MDKNGSLTKWMGFFLACLVCAATYGVLTASVDRNVIDIAENTKLSVANTTAIAELNREIIERLAIAETKLNTLLKRSE
jgi:hypothetical protein